MAGQRGWQQWQSQQQQPSPPWVQTHGPQNPPWQGQGFTAGGHSQPGGYSHKTEFQIHSMFLWAGKPHEMSHLLGLESPFILSWLVGLDNLFLLRTSSVEGVYEVALGEVSTWK